MKIDRLLSIVMLLLYRRTTTVGELAGHFEVSERTIYRDLQSLDLAGFPLVSSTGRGGGIGLLPGYRLENRLLSSEALSILATSLTSIAHVLGDSKLVDDAKLCTALAGEDAGLSPISYQFEVPGSGLASSRLTALLSEIANAMRESRCIALDYTSAEAQTSHRQVEPLRLAWIGMDWYLQAWCRLREDYRLFRLQRIVSVRILDADFDRGTRLEAAPEPRFDQPKPSQEVILLRIDSSRGDLRERFASQLVDSREAGYFMLKFDWPIDQWVHAWILGLGPGVIVESPHSLRREIAKSVRAMADTLQEYQD